MDQSKINKDRYYRLIFASVYPMYIKKVESKGRRKDELDEIIFWLTGYDKKTLKAQIDKKSDFETFFKEAPKFNPKAKLITGMICGYRVEEIEDKVVWKMRCLDKMIDELAKGKTMDKILRK